MQETAGRCLVDLTTADAVFFQDERVNEDYNSQDIARLTTMLNKHVNGLIMSIIEFELVDAVEARSKVWSRKGHVHLSTEDVGFKVNAVVGLWDVHIVERPAAWAHLAKLSLLLH